VQSQTVAMVEPRLLHLTLEPKLAPPPVAELKFLKVVMKALPKSQPKAATQHQLKATQHLPKVTLLQLKAKKHQPKANSRVNGLNV
tara:strand:- start:17615 stop:17872 length:258 start_codon:yes stop_codon:yes gene_type:complete